MDQFQRHNAFQSEPCGIRGPILHRQPLSTNFLLKRNPKYLHCNFIHFRSAHNSNPDFQVSRALQRTKHLKKLENLQSIISFKNYTKLLKRHNQGVDTYQVLHSLHNKPLSLVKQIAKKLKHMRKFNVRFNIPVSICIKYAKQLACLTISTQGHCESNYAHRIKQVLRKTVKRLYKLRRLYIITGEAFQDRVEIQEILEASKNIKFLKEIYMRFQHLSLRKYDSLVPIDLNGGHGDLIVSLQDIPHPVFLFNVLQASTRLRNLHTLFFKLSLMDQRNHTFDFKALENLKSFESLRNLEIKLELCENYHDFFLEYIRFPPTLKRLSLGLERLEYKRVAEGKKENIRAFFKSYKALQLDELFLNVAINHDYSVAYCRFIRPFMLLQKELRSLKLKHSFAMHSEKIKEKKHLHISEIFNDLKNLQKLEYFDGNFEILDFSQKDGNSAIELFNLKNVILNAQEVIWQEKGRRGFIEETLRYLAHCKNIRTLLLQNRCNKEPECLKRSLVALMQFEELEKVQINWNIDTLKVEELCSFLDNVKKSINVNFGLRQILLSRDDLDAIMSSIVRNKALAEVKIQGLQCEVSKYGMHGNPCEYGYSGTDKSMDLK